MAITDDVKVDITRDNDGLGVTIEALFSGMQGLISSKTVVGEPIEADGVKIIPLIEVTAGLASGALGKAAKQNGAGAMSAKITPVALLVLEGGRMRLINVKSPDAVTKLLDMVPDLVDRVTGKYNLSPRAEAAAQSAAEVLEPEIICNGEE